MAERSGAIGLWAAATVAALVLGTLMAVFWRAGSFGASFTAADWAAVRFTVTQAILSSAISTALAVPLARALARRQFTGRRLLITLLGAPFILPVIVAVLGLLAIFGRNGLVNGVLDWAGLPTLQIYGLDGVVLAHVFFNLPLATRLILQGWADIPAERFRLAASLGFSARDMRRHLEAPMLRQVIPGCAMAVFLICLTSFAVALTLGGGPRATTVELAIYQAFRFDFDLARAAMLSLVQFGLATAAALLAWRLTPISVAGGGMDRVPQRFDGAGTTARALDAGLIGLGALFLLLPLVMVVLGGAGRLFDLPPSIWWAAGRSLAVAAASVVIALGLALPMALSIAAGRRGAGAIEVIGAMTIANSPLVLGTGLFLILFPIADPQRLALVVTALVNALAAMPFVLRSLVPSLRQMRADYSRLADSLGLSGWNRLRWLVIPRLRAPLAFSCGLTAALSIGDLGVIALFADPERATLPLAIYQLMGSYRMEQAAAASVLLMVLSLGVFWALDRVGR
ncbi:MAG: thiamine/thiamine pyrophosphate ABC transporter permease ThiP [Pseudomonadota bacterium]